MATDNLQEGLKDVIKLHFESIKKDGLTAENTTTKVNNVVRLYQLYQKDCAEENRHDEAADRLAYDNGRADLEQRAKEHQIKNESDKLELDRERLDFERERFQCELAVKEEANEIEKAKLHQSKIGQIISAATAATGTVFNLWVTSAVMGLEEKGVVTSFIAKKIFGSMLGRQKTE